MTPTIQAVLDGIAAVTVPSMHMSYLAPGETPSFRLEKDGVGGLWVWETNSGRIWAEFDDVGRLVAVVDYLKVDFPIDTEVAARWEAHRVEMLHPTAADLAAADAPDLGAKTLVELTEPF